MNRANKKKNMATDEESNPSQESNSPMGLSHSVKEYSRVEETTIVKRGDNFKISHSTNMTVSSVENKTLNDDLSETSIGLSRLNLVDRTAATPAPIRKQSENTYMDGIKTGAVKKVSDVGSANKQKSLNLSSPRNKTIENDVMQNSIRDSPRSSSNTNPRKRMKMLKDIDNGHKTSPPPIQQKRLQPAKVYILNHQIFEDHVREGSSNDVANLQQTFKKFHCDVNIKDNPTRRMIDLFSTRLKNEDFTNFSALVIVILSHGMRHEQIATTDGLIYSLDDDILFSMLENPNLLNKPKLFFVQACKGDKKARVADNESNEYYSYSEILKCYSSFEGFESYRESSGSYFITELCEALRSLGMTVDIETIMKTVRTRVMERTRDRGEQIPSVTSTLTRNYIFGDYIQQ